MKESPIYKKALFLAARRALLENELIVREYVEHNLPEHYTEKDLEDLCEMLEKLFDNDLLDVIMGQKSAEYFEGVYDVRLLKDMADFAKKYKALKKERI